MAKGGWVFDLNRIKVGEKLAFTEDLGKGTDEALHKWLARCVQSSPKDVEGDLRVEANWNELGMVDHREAVAAFTEAFFRFQQIGPDVGQKGVPAGETGTAGGDAGAG